MPLECFAQELLGGSQIASLAEPELDRIPVAVNRAIQIPPLATDPDIGFVDMPPAGDRALALVEALQEQGCVMYSLAMDGRVIDSDAALGHHLFEISQAQAVSEIPPHAQQDHRTIKMTAFEHVTLRSVPEG
jgi:hypothetical protein